MADKSQFGQKDDRSGQQQQKQGNLGQKEAQQQQKSDSELDRMGEKAREPSQKQR